MEAQNSVNDETNSNITDENGMHFTDEASALRIGLSSLQSSSLYTDVTLKAEGISIPAHKVVLAAVSNYFRLMFSHEFKESITGVVHLPNISPTILKTVLTYIYTGNVTISDDSVKDILQAAHLMELPFLVESCQLFLMEELDLKNAVTIMQISKLYDLKDTTASSFEYILDHFYGIPDNEIFKLTSSELIEIVSDDMLRVQWEDDVLNVIIRWLEYTKEENYDVAFKLMTAVRFSKLSLDYVHKLKLKEKFQNRLCCNFIENILSHLTASHRERSGSSTNLFIIGMNYDRSALTFMKLDTISGNNSKLDSISVQSCDYYIHRFVFVKNKFYIIRNDRKVVCFDLVEHRWISCCPMIYNRNNPVVVDHDGLIYVCGGGYNDKIMRTVERYDPETDKWTEVASMIDPRNAAFGAVLNGRIYVMGGVHEHSRISTCEYYDSELNSWQSFNPLPEPLSYASVVAYQDALYVTGGENSDWKPTDSFYKYDLHTKKWSSCSKLPFKTSTHISCAIDGKIYVIKNRKEFELGIFDIDSGQWQVKELQDLDNDLTFFIHCSNMRGFLV